MLSGERLKQDGARVLWAVSVLLLAGTLVDLGVLWIGQRVDSLQWEFVALVNTVEGLSGLILAVAFAYTGLLVGEASAPLAFKALAVGLIVLGALGGALSLLLLTDYAAMRNGIPPEGMTAFKTTTFKAIALGALYLGLLVPVGVSGLRRSRSRRR